MKQYTHVFFDLDRTLWDLELNAHHTLVHLFQNYRLAQYFSSIDQFIDQYKVINKNLWAAYTRGDISKDRLRTSRFFQTLKSVKVVNFELAQSLDKDYVANCPKQTALLPNCIETLSYLKNKGYKMSIITNGFADVQRTKLESCSLQSYFDHVIDSELVGHAKPSVKIFQYALNLYKITPDKAIMVGDDWEADIYGAACSGIDQIYINVESKFEGAANHKISNLNQIKELI